MPKTLEEFLATFKNQQHTQDLQKIPNEFTVKHDEEENTTQITIYGTIGSSWWSESFSAKDLDRALKAAKDNDIIVNLNSPGGSAFDGISIYNRLRRHKGKVTVNIDGYACSAASIIAMAGDEVVMGLGSMIMIHEASSIVWGTKQDMRAEADVLEELEEGIIDIYMTKTNLKREEVQEKVNAETWMSAKKAVSFGFADSQEGESSTEEESEEIETLSNEDKRTILNELRNVLGKEHEQERNNILANFKRQ